jgi:hypothetical protein
MCLEADGVNRSGKIKQDTRKDSKKYYSNIPKREGERKKKEKKKVQ